MPQRNRTDFEKTVRLQQKKKPRKPLDPLPEVRYQAPSVLDGIPHRIEGQPTASYTPVRVPTRQDMDREPGRANGYGGLGLARLMSIKENNKRSAPYRQQLDAFERKQKARRDARIVSL